MKGILPNQHLVTMRALVNMTPIPPSYHFGGYFPDEKWASDEVMWEVRYSSGGMTPFVAPGAPAPTIGMDGIGGKNAKAAFWKEKAFLDEQILNNLRAAGTFADKQRAEKTLAEQTMKLTNRCLAREEWMCAKAITTGAITYQNMKGVKINVDYGIPAVNKIVLSSDYMWGTGTKRNPMQNLFDAKVSLANNFGVAPTRCIMNTMTMKLLMFDNTFTALNAKSQFGEGDVYKNPPMVLGNLLGVGPLEINDNMYEAQLDFLSNIVAGATISSITVADASDAEVGGLIRFYSGIMDNVWEDFTISAVNKTTNVITISPLNTLTGTITPTGSYIVGRDAIVMRKKFVPDNLVVLMADRVDGLPIGNFAKCPHGMGGNYGMLFTDWMDDDPEGTYIRVQNKGLPMLYHPEAICLIQVGTNLIG